VVVGRLSIGAGASRPSQPRACHWVLVLLFQTNHFTQADLHTLFTTDCATVVPRSPRVQEHQHANGSDQGQQEEEDFSEAVRTITLHFTGASVDHNLNPRFSAPAAAFQIQLSWQSER
jgi:hypothetical protein